MAKRKTSKDKIELEKLKKASMAIEDLVWSLQSLKMDALKDASDYLRESVDGSESRLTVSEEYKSQDPNKHFLIGVLPRLFQDKKIFPTNEDIVDFASTALGLEMSRSEKRSRYEIIGKVVCETDLLDESRLTMLVSALEKLVGDNEKLEQMASRKKAGSFSWNETLQELLNS